MIHGLLVAPSLNVGILHRIYMQSLPLKLAPGSDLRLSLENVGREQNCSGFVLGIVGNLSRACFQCPGRTKPTVLEGNLEIITLNGTFSPKSVHLHLSLSDTDCQVWGGHLEPGTILLKGADLLLGLLDNEQSRETKQTNSNQINFNPNKKARLEIAVIPGCPWSNRAIRLLKSLDIPHNIKMIDNDSSFNNLKEKSGLNTFPQIFIDGKLLGGYDALVELNSSGNLIQFR